MPHAANSDLATPENSGSEGRKYDAHLSPHLLAIAQLLELMGLKRGTPEYIEQFQLELDKGHQRQREREEREREREEREREREEREREREERDLERKRNHEIRMRELEIEALKSSSQPDTSEGKRQPIQFPDLPKYKAGYDIMTYLDRYRVQIEIRKYTEHEACVLLHQLLPEELVTVIERLPEDQRHKLDSVSEHLISAAGYKPEDFCRQYYQAKPDEYDNMYRFALRQLRNFRLWVELRQAAREYDALENFVVLETIVRRLPHDIVAQIRKEYKGDLLKVAEHVDRHIGIHYSKSKFVQLYNTNNANKNQHNCTTDGDSNDGRRGNGQTRTNKPTQSENSTSSSYLNDRSSQNRESTGGNSGNSRTNSNNYRSNQQSNSCGSGFRGNYNNYNSNNKKEYHRNADESTNWRGNYRGSHVSDTNYGSFGGWGGPYNKNRSQQSGNSGNPDPSQTGNQANLVHGDSGTVVVLGSRENSAEVESRESASAVVVINNNSCSAPHESSTNLMTCYGQINGQPARIVLDTGASGLFVNKKFLKSQALGPKHNVSCAFADSHECHSAVVELDCPYFKGVAPALVQERSLHDALLGCIPGVKPFPGSIEARELDDFARDAEISLLAAPSSGSVSSEDVVTAESAGLQASSVVTRSMSRRDSLINEHVPLEPAQTVDMMLADANAFKEEQQKCPTLAYIRSQIGIPKRHGKHVISTVVECRGLLYYADQTTSSGLAKGKSKIFISDESALPVNGDDSGSSANETGDGSNSLLEAAGRDNGTQIVLSPELATSSGVSGELSGASKQLSNNNDCMNLQPEFAAGDMKYGLVVPLKFRRLVMYIGHTIPLSGHRALATTLGRISRNFVWPNMTDDVKLYVRNCHVCQISGYSHKPRAYPMQVAKLADSPFSRVSVDLIGPLPVTTPHRFKYILMYVDNASRYAEAIPLRDINASTVADALFEIGTRVGFPTTLCSDNGAQFTSEMFSQYMNLLGSRHIRSSPYHAAGNGIVERLNGTLKVCLSKLAQEVPTVWDKYLPTVMFCYRDSPHASTGYSPLEVVYGHQVQGPLEFLKECFEPPTLEQEDYDLHEYVLNLKSRLRETCKLAHEHLRESQLKNKVLFDKRSRTRMLCPGDKVLILLPTSSRKLLLKWRGPYVVTARLSPVLYRVHVEDSDRIYHINLLKEYHANSHDSENGDTYSQHAGHSDDVEAVVEAACNSYTPDVCLALSLACEDETADMTSDRDPYIPTVAAESYEDCLLGSGLSPDQTKALQDLLMQNANVLSDLPGRTNTVHCHVTLRDGKAPIRHSYELPHALEPQFQQELLRWLELGIVEPSSSPYCSPLIAVRKKDGTHHFCLDCRQLNLITVPDLEPIANQAHIFTKLSSAKYLSKLDLASGFWQIGLSEATRPMTAFRTRSGHFQFCVMPFGI